MALDFFRNRLDAMVDMRHPLAVLASRIPWDAIDRILTPMFAHTARPVVSVEAADLSFCHSAGLDWDASEALSSMGSKAVVCDNIESLILAVTAAAKSNDHLLWMSNGRSGRVH